MTRLETLQAALQEVLGSKLKKIVVDRGEITITVSPDDYIPAALALRAAGAAKVAIVVIGRHFDRGFGDCETYYQQAKTFKFTWDYCCLEHGAGDIG